MWLFALLPYPRLRPGRWLFWLVRLLLPRGTFNALLLALAAALLLGLVPDLRAPKTASVTRPTAINGAVTGAVTHVRDGDTIEVARLPIRIANLDCAESGTPAGEAATARMRQLVTGQTLTCALEGRKSWDREVGTCALAGGADLGEILIAEGACARWR